VTDTPPSLLTNVVWTCVASAGSSCGTNSGVNRIAVTNATVAPQGSLVYTLTGMVPFGTAAAAPFANTATVSANATLYTDPTSSNNTSTVNGTVAFGRATLSPSPATIPATQTGLTGQTVVTLSNTGTTTVVLGTPTVTGTALSLAATTCSSIVPLPAGATCTCTVQFRPTVQGNVTGSLSVPSGAGTLTDVITAQATTPVVVVGSATLAVTPGAVALTTAPANTQTKNALVTLSNTGTAPLNLTGAAVTNPNLVLGRFSVTFTNGATCPSVNGALSGTLAAGSNCTINVRYVPVLPFINSSVLTLSTPGASTSSTTVNLSGN
jgi:hypothetical protein